MKSYIVVQAHSSNYPNPIHLRQGERIQIGHKYEGPEQWNDWYFCKNEAGIAGWVPRQVFTRDAPNDAEGVVIEEYNAFEMDAVPGDRVTALRELNGWIWCRREADDTQGWLPLDHLQLLLNE
ncbi:SH3 domain-containing protein [Paenibacillus wenxiniae]|uniref:SH3 domain-containing protein n=1 Tax=Paenibacillus wenxiniae TaxID=1636843 RepID=A0ABW4RPH9_9BACL